MCAIGAFLILGADRSDASTFDGNDVELCFKFFGLEDCLDPVTVDATPGAVEFASAFDFSIDLTGSEILLTALNDIFAGPGVSEFGFEFVDPLGSSPDGFPMIVGATVLSSDYGLLDDALSWSANQLFVNLAGYDITSGEELLVGVEFGDASIVPLPATLPLALAGIGALGLLRRRKAA